MDDKLYQSIMRGITERTVNNMDCEYRVWHENTRKMCDVYYINWDTEEAGICIEGACTLVSLKFIKLMKNTHMQDIVGADIYEGDFIESHQGTKILDILMLIKYGTYEAYCPADEAYTENVGFYVEAVGYPQMPLGPLNDYARVIGNVYENAEWLDEQTLVYNRSAGTAPGLPDNKLAAINSVNTTV